MSRIFAAHIQDDRIQTVKCHLEETAQLAREFAMPKSDNAYVCALLHDIGKYSDQFQKCIQGLSKNKVDHSTAGAVELNRVDPFIGFLLA